MATRDVVDADDSAATVALGEVDNDGLHLDDAATGLALGADLVALVLFLAAESPANGAEAALDAHHGFDFSL